MTFHILPTDADFAELHPQLHPGMLARREREKRRGLLGKIFARLVQIVVLGILSICIFADFKNTATIAQAIQRPITNSFILLIFFVGTYHLFMWRVELFFIRRFRRGRANIKAWLNDPNFDHNEGLERTPESVQLTELPVIAAPTLHFKGDPTLN